MALYFPLDYQESAGRVFIYMFNLKGCCVFNKDSYAPGLGLKCREMMEFFRLSQKTEGGRQWRNESPEAV